MPNEESYLELLDFKICDIEFSVVGPTGQILQAYGRTEIVMGCSFSRAGTNFVLNFFLIPVYGINGAAMATGSSLAFMNEII